MKGAPGTRITLKHGELLKTDGRLEQGNIDVYYHPVKPGEVFQMDVFTLKGTGEEEIFMPSFAYHGFQHVEVESSRSPDKRESDRTVHAHSGRARRLLLLLRSVVEQNMEGDNGSLS